MNATYPLVLLVVATASIPLARGDTTRPGAHAPIGVMGDHMHRVGEYMVSYQRT